MTENKTARSTISYLIVRDHADVLNIGRIFHMEDRAQNLVYDMQTRIATVQKRVSNHLLVPVAILQLFLGSGPTGTYRVVGAGCLTM